MLLNDTINEKSLFDSKGFFIFFITGNSRNDTVNDKFLAAVVVFSQSISILYAVRMFSENCCLYSLSSIQAMAT